MKTDTHGVESTDDETRTASLDSLVVRLIAPAERESWDGLVAKHHYLGQGGMVGETMRYVALLDDRFAALLGWGAAAFKSRHRNRFIGWEAGLQWSRLRLIANNVRFLILPGIRVPNLASKTLSLNLKRLSDDWQAVYGHPILLAETFVDQSRFRGTCYLAAGWRVLGETRGFGRSGGKYYEHGRPKTMLVKPLRRDALSLLADPLPHPELLTEEPKLHLAASRLDQKGGLLDYLRVVPDPRHKRGIRHRMLPVLAVSACAVLSGARSIKAIAEWGHRCSQSMLRRLSCRYDHRRGRFVPPSEPTLRRLLQKVDAGAVDRAVGAWLLAQTPAGEGKAIARGGKTLRGSKSAEGKPMHLVAAILHREGVVIGQEAVDEKSNEIPAVKPLLAELPIQGMVVTADAMHTQHKTARFIVEEKRADYLLTVKDNQPTLRNDIAALNLNAFPPSARNGR